LGVRHRTPLATYPGTAWATLRQPRPARSPIWSCSGWGLPCHHCCQRRGALLPHHFTLTGAMVWRLGGMFSVALSVGSRPPGVTWHPALWSPDFPPWRRLRPFGPAHHSDCPVDSQPLLTRETQVVARGASWKSWPTRVPLCVGNAHGPVIEQAFPLSREPRGNGRGPCGRQFLQQDPQ